MHQCILLFVKYWHKISGSHECKVCNFDTLWQVYVSTGKHHFAAFVSYLCGVGLKQHWGSIQVIGWLISSIIL